MSTEAERDNVLGTHDEEVLEIIAERGALR
jgi:hypothetical protein